MRGQAVQEHPRQLVKRVVGLGPQSLAHLEGSEIAPFRTSGSGEVGKLEWEGTGLIDEELILLFSDEPR